MKVEAIFSQSLLDTRLRVLLIDCIRGMFKQIYKFINLIGSNKIGIFAGRVEKELLLRAAKVIDFISIEDNATAEEGENEIHENR